MNLRFKVIAIAQPTNIGDVIASLPMAAAIKRHSPSTRVIFIAREYTKAVVEASRNVDCFIDAGEVLANPTVLYPYKIDAFVNPFLHQELGLAAVQCKIPIRIGNIRRIKSRSWANHFIFENSQYNPRHIANINLRYLKPLGLDVQYSLVELANSIDIDPERIPTSPQVTAMIDPTKFNLIIHPKSNKSGREWPEKSILEILRLLPPDKFKVFLTGLKAEQEGLKKTCPEILEFPGVVNTMGQFSLNQLLALIRSVDGLLASGTGPLHLAAALGIHALGLFPGRDRANRRKWHPLGRKAEAMAVRDFCLPIIPGRCPQKYRGESCDCMNRIRAEAVANRISAWVQ